SQKFSLKNSARRSNHCAMAKSPQPINNHRESRRANAWRETGKYSFQEICNQRQEVIMNATLTRDESISSLGANIRTEGANHRAWVVKSAKQPMKLEVVDLGPFQAEDVEVAVEHCGLCHSDLSVLNNEWGISEYPAVLGHEAIGRITDIGPNVKGVAVGQRVGVGW